VGSLIGLSVTTVEARLFNHYVFGAESAMRRVAQFASAGGFVGFGLGALDGEELRRMGKYVGIGGAIGLVTGTAVGAVFRIPEGFFAGAYVGTGLGILVGTLTNLLDRPDAVSDPTQSLEARVSVPIGIRVNF